MPQPVPTRDATGRTDKEFMADLFEFELCDECGQDADAHVASLLPFTNCWFAHCLKGKQE